jgi:hypothetical protein
VQARGSGAEKVRETRPDVYVKVVASLLPREIEARVSDLTWEEALEQLAALDKATPTADLMAYADLDAPPNARVWGQNGHDANGPLCPLMTQS